jgi:hypothetical protein
MFQFGEGHVAYNTSVKVKRTFNEEGYFEKIWTTLVKEINVT